MTPDGGSGKEDREDENYLTSKFVSNSWISLDFRRRNILKLFMVCLRKLDKNN